MTVRAYRITQTKYVPTAFDGEGARLYGGRWNSVGTSVIYVASSLSLATLELLVHTEDLSIIHNDYSVIPVDFSEKLMQSVDPASLTKGWDAPEPSPETQMLGDAWAAGGSSLVLQVPSVVSVGEVNYLINPSHSDFSKLSHRTPHRFQPDARLQQRY